MDIWVCNLIAILVYCCVVALLDFNYDIYFVHVIAIQSMELPFAKLVTIALLPLFQFTLRYLFCFPLQFEMLSNILVRSVNPQDTVVGRF